MDQTLAAIESDAIEMVAGAAPVAAKKMVQPEGGGGCILGIRQRIRNLSSARFVGETQIIKRPAAPDQIVQGKVIVRLNRGEIRSLRGNRKNQTGIRSARTSDDSGAVGRVKQSGSVGKVLRDSQIHMRAEPELRIEIHVLRLLVLGRQIFIDGKAASVAERIAHS